MKNSFWVTLLFSFLIGSFSCSNPDSSASSSSTSAEPAAPLAGQSGVKDDQSQKDAGPFTVFAPTNAAFDKLPKGTVEELMKPENKMKLRNILEYHVYVGVLKPEMLQDGQTFGQANGQSIKIGVSQGKITVNGAAVVASIPASNGIIHVIDAVLLPPAE